MKILQVGVAKSGNFWLYKIIHSIIDHSGLQERSFIKKQRMHKLAKTWDLSYKEQADIDVLDIETHKCFYRISSIFRMPIKDITEYINQCNHVWTHSAFCERCLDVFSKFDKIVYIIRDPRDVLISMSRFAFSPYMKNYYPTGEISPDEYLSHTLNGTMKHWMYHCGRYLKHKSDLQIHFVFYERLLRSFNTEIASLLEYLGIELDEEVISNIKQETDFATMKSNNPSHISKGRSGDWMQVFTEEQKRRSARITGPLLKLLHYPVGGNQANTLPCMPAQLCIEQTDEIISHINQRTFIGKVKHACKLIK